MKKSLHYLIDRREQQREQHQHRFATKRLLAIRQVEMNKGISVTTSKAVGRSYMYMTRHYETFTQLIVPDMNNRQYVRERGEEEEMK